MKKKIFLGLLAAFVVMQFFRIDKTNPESDPNHSMFVVEQMPQEVKSIIKTACFDCHSNQVTYPWYSNVAPVSWLVKDHINEARDELNFSEWGTYTMKRKLHKLEEIEEEVGEGEMPLPSYLLAHSNAKLTKEQKNKLIIWAKKLRTGEKIEEK
ncbi:MAG: heme-binding domain-containing protein [Cyclobacteriaceae bacterium]|nr:heme-binding domain-containing protein [Cyclobacteriaceae bacterium]